MKKKFTNIDLNEPKNWVISKIIFDKCKKEPKFEIIEFTDGSKWTYHDLCSFTLKAANQLNEIGVKKGENIVVIIDNPKKFIPIWLAASFLGLIFIPINTGLRGDVLEHQIKISSPKIMIVEEKYIDRIFDIKIYRKETVIINVNNFFFKKKIDLKKIIENKKHDISCIMFTSGTSGKSKGVIMPNAHCVLFAIGTIENYKLKQGDRFYICLPLYHANGLFMQLLACMINRNKAFIREKFSASKWLYDIRRFNITHTNMLGAVGAFIVAQPKTKLDKKHNLQLVGSAPLPIETEKEFRIRFGIKFVLPLYGMTEVNIPIYGRMNDKNNGSCGKVYKKYFEVEIRDPETDDKKKDGETGEIVVRPKVSYGFMQGYIGMPEESFKSYRNFWFHTGDAGFRKASGHFVFVDRIKDCIRRRGENISSYEVEQAFLKIPEIIEAAAYAVPAKGGSGLEDEVMIALMVRNSKDKNYLKWIKDASPNLANFSMPKYIRIVKNFPKTGTGKIKKYLLKEEGITKDTWIKKNILNKN